MQIATVLDQHLSRVKPALIARQQTRRGRSVELTELQLLAQQERRLEEQRSSRQGNTSSA
jgi:seryl-tRNA synthetase